MGGRGEGLQVDDQMQHATTCAAECAAHNLCMTIGDVCGGQAHGDTCAHLSTAYDHQHSIVLPKTLTLLLLPLLLVLLLLLLLLQNGGGDHGSQQWTPELPSDSGLLFYLCAAFLAAPGWNFPSPGLGGPDTSRCVSFLLCACALKEAGTPAGVCLI